MASVTLRSFAGGELDPGLQARVDNIKYATGANSIYNLVCMKSGGLTNRAGTRFVGEVKDSSKKVRLIDFVFNKNQTYVLEFGHQYMRVIRNGAYVLEATKAITAITQANPGVVTSNAHGYNDGDEIYIAGINGMTQLNGRNFRVKNKTTNTYQLETLAGVTVNTTPLSAYSSAGTSARVYTMTTYFAESDLAGLSYDQSKDVVSFASEVAGVYDLGTIGHTNWFINAPNWNPPILAPLYASWGQSGAAGAPGEGVNWFVTAVDENGQESMASETLGSLNVKVTNGNPSGSAPWTYTWPASTGAKFYRVYRTGMGFSQPYGLIGTTTSLSYIDYGGIPDFEKGFLRRSDIFDPDSYFPNYPSAVCYFQQRRIYANLGVPGNLRTSAIGLPLSFNILRPLPPDGPVDVTLESRTKIKALIDIGNLIALTEEEEMVIQGDVAGILRPAEVNPRRQSYNGCGDLRPIVVNNHVLYPQARNSAIHFLSFSQENGFLGEDLTIFSSHLFEGHEIVSWAYQKNPHSIAWCVRDDGVMLGLTYIPGQQMWGWHRHETDGQIESVTVVPEGREDVLYMVVKRTVGGATRRYVERMTNRKFIDQRDGIFVDSSLTYDGRNTGSTTMTISGGTNWGHLETLTLTASTSFFNSSMVGSEIHFTVPGLGPLRFAIAGYTSGTVVTGTVATIVPENLRAAATTAWARAVKTVSGLWHLEGRKVSVVGDAFEVANENLGQGMTVENASLTLPSCFAVIHVGLPYYSELETLNLESIQGETLTNKKTICNQVTAKLSNSLGGWFGQRAPAAGQPRNQGLVQMKQDLVAPLGLQAKPFSGDVTVNIPADWKSNGRVHLRQLSPSPFTVLSVTPTGVITQGGM